MPPTCPNLRSAAGCLLLGGLLLMSGCYESDAGRLQGRWRGTPDTAAARAQRKAKRLQKAGKAVQTDSSQPNKSKSKGDRPRQPLSDWEQFDFFVLLDFVDQRKVRISLGDQGEPVEGSWQVIESSGDRVTIQIKSDSPVIDGKQATPDGSSDAASGDTRRDRQFVIRFEGKKKECFTMTEDGADPLQGRLFFQRAD